MRWQLIGGAILFSAGVVACGDDSSAGSAGGGSGGGAASTSDAGSTTSSTVTGSGGAGGGDEYVPGPGEIVLESPPYTVEAGEEVKYQCFTFEIPDGDAVVKEIEPLYGDAIHHIAVYQPLAPEEEGVHTCPVFKPTWIPLYVGGLDSGKLTLPEGAGFELRGGQQVIVQLHLLNATAEPIEDTASVVLRTTDEADVTPAGIFGMDNRALSLPPRSEDAETTMTCTPDHDLDVFALLGHMHTLGTFIQLSRGTEPGGEILYERDYRFEEQPTEPIDLHVAAGEPLFVRCVYDNPGDDTVTYGESTAQEMCVMALYYTPFTGLDGCVEID